MRRYNELWTKAQWLRGDLAAFRRSIAELQAELDRELREVLWVSEGIKSTEGQDDA